MPKQDILAISASCSTISRNTTTIANMLDQQESQLFHDPRNFIYELLQNAEDAKLDNQETGAGFISFHLMGNDLVVSHNGAPFNKNDIERICDASRDTDPDVSAKSNQAEKIGYKGIGFKAVFKLSKEVLILSPQTDYFFRFSKQYWDDKKEQIKNTHPGINFPWQITPIWLEEEERASFVTPNITTKKPSVIFVFKNIHSSIIHSELLEFIKHPERMIFLKKIQTIFYEESNNIHELKKRELSNNLFSIQYKNNHTLTSENLWHVHHFNINVNDNDLSEALEAMALSACPQKIRTAKTTDITFAVPIEKNHNAYQFKPLKKGTVFCYLPTTVECRLPFLINARFILNQDRSTIINDHPWNNFLFHAIAKEQFRWLGEMAKNASYQKSVLNLLSSSRASEVFPQLKKVYGNASTSEMNYNLLQSYQRGFDLGLNSVPFILSKSGELLRLRECVLDITGFFEKFDEKFLNPELFSSLHLVAYHLDNFRNLEQCQDVFVYDDNCLQDNVESYMAKIRGPQYIELRSNILDFLLKRNSAFKAKKILLNTQNQLCNGEESFLPSHNQSIAGLDFLNLNIVNPAAYLPNVFDLLIHFVNPLTVEMIVTKHVAKLINNDEINQSNSVPILQFIYFEVVKNKLLLSLFKKTSDNNTSTVNLGHFKVITQSGQLRSLNTCFYGSNHFPPDRLLSEYYYTNVHDWNIFNELMLISGMLTQAELTVSQKSYVDALAYFNQFGKGSLIEEYTRYVINNIPTTEKGISGSCRQELNRVFFNNFIHFDFLFHDNVPSDAMLYLFYIALEKQQALYSQQPTISWKYYSSNLFFSIQIHFLSYYFQNYVKIKVLGHNKNKLARDLVYIPELLKGNVFNTTEMSIDFIAELPVSLSHATVQFLGFRESISLHHGLAILEQFNLRYIKKNISIDPSYIENLRFIYRLLIASEPGNYNEALRVFKESNSPLLSKQKKFTSAKNIEIFDEEIASNEDVQKASFWLHDAGLSHDELLKLSAILEIPRHSNDHNFTVQLSKDAVENNSVASLKAFILELLPIFILIEAEELNKDYQPLHEKTFDTLSSLNFVYCASIHFNSGYQSHNAARLKDNNLYISGRSKPRSKALAKKLSEHFFQSEQTKQRFKTVLESFPGNEETQNLIHWIKQFPEREEKYQNMVRYQSAKTVNIPQKANTTHHFVQPKTATPVPPTPSASLPPQYPSPLPQRILTGFNLLSKPANEQPQIHQNKIHLPFDPAHSPVEITQKSSAQKPLKALGNEEVVGTNLPAPAQKLNFAESDNNASSSSASDERKKQIGDTGEHHVFKKMIYLLQTQLQTVPQSIRIPHPESDDTTKQVNSTRFIKNENIIDVIWYNQDRGETAVIESPVDIVVALNHQIRYFIEVKSTPALNESMFFLTTNEWKYMREQSGKSILVRAYGIDTDNVRFEVYKNPFEMIIKGLIGYMTGGSFILQGTKKALEAHAFEKDEQIGCAMQ